MIENTLVNLFPTDMWHLILRECDRETKSNLALVDTFFNKCVIELFKNLKLLYSNEEQASLEDFFNNYNGYIQVLSLAGIKESVSVNQWQILFNKQFHIQTLDVSETTQVTFESLVSGSKLSKLKTLIARNCRFITDEGLKKVTIAFNKIKKFDLGFTDRHNECLLKNEDLYPLEELKDLEILNLQGRVIHNSANIIRLDFLNRLSMRLREIYLSFEFGILEDIHEYVLSRRSIELISLQRKFNNYVSVPSKESKIVGLKYFYCIDKSPTVDMYRDILQPSLLDLSINPQLFNLNSFLMMLYEKCTQLERLALICVNLSQLESFGFNGNFSCLKSLRLMYATGSAIGLEKLLQKCPNIEDLGLTLNECKGFNDKTPGLPQNMQLRTLDFCSNTLTSVGIKKMSEAYPGLKILKLPIMAWSLNIIKSVMDAWPDLEEIHLSSDCPKEVVEWLHENQQNLRIAPLNSENIRF